MYSLYFLMKPASHTCNLACPYCFYQRVEQIYPMHHPYMNEETLKKFFQNVFTTEAKHFTFTWQGGEPTLLGLDFFQKVAEYQQKFSQSGQIVENTFQTNGILLNQEWARFLQAAGFLVGISLDGPEAIHDHYRYFHDGRGSFNQVMKAIENMNAAGTLFNVLTLLTTLNVRETKLLYDFFKQNKFTHLQFIPCYEWDKKTHKPQPYSIDGKSLADFYIQLFDLWYPQDMGVVSVRFFEDVLLYLLDHLHASCTWMKRCDSYLVVEHNGDVYPCDFYVYPEWKLGNVLQDNIQNLLYSSKRDRFATMKSTLPSSCKQCPWLDFCNGDCTKSRSTVKGRLKPSVHCQGIKNFFEYLHPRLPEITERAFLMRQTAQNK